MATEAAPLPTPLRRRRAWLAALLSLIWLGLGQIYNGEGQKALALITAWLVLASMAVILTIATDPAPASVAMVCLLAILVAGLVVYAAVDAFRRARHARAVAPKRYQRVWVYVLVVAAWVLISSVFPELVRWRPFSVPSASMLPTVIPGEYVMTLRYSPGEAPQRGDLATFYYPRNRSIDYFKRIIGLPGDRVQLRAGVVYINGAPLPRQPARDASLRHAEMAKAEQYIETMPEGRRHLIAKRADSGWLNNTAEFIVPAGHYFVLGDNRDSSFDSREAEIGFIPRDDMTGRAYVVYWSAIPSRIGTRLE